MTSLAAHLASAFLRWRVKPRLTAAPNLEAAATALTFRLPFAASRGGRTHRFGDIDGEWRPAQTVDAAATLLYLHGGAYFAGSPQLYRPVLRAFSKKGFDVFAPAYRLAPRDPFPAAIEDARKAYAALQARSARPIVVAGDSAGGGLALALMVALRDAGEALPKAAVLFSPWTDLAATGASVRENEARDALFTRRMLKIAARAYLGETNARHPLASPLYADLSGLPPLLAHVGVDEVLRDDATRLVARAQAAGVAAEIKLWPGVPHGWQLAAPFMPEARESLDAAADHLLRHLA